MVVTPGGTLTLSVVVPAFNEQQRIGSTVGTLAAYLRTREWDWDIRVVDDGSTDGTAAAVMAAAGTDARIVVQREPHRGKGGAVRAGLSAAQGAYRFMCDADLAMPVEYLERFLPPLVRDADVAIGSREGAAARRVGEPFYRHLVGRLFNAAVQSCGLEGIEDTQCGFKMFTADAVAAIFPSVTIDGWAFDVEVLTIARRRGLRIVDVPIEWHGGQASKVRVLPDGFRMMRDVWRVRSRARAGRYGGSVSEK